MRSTEKYIDTRLALTLQYPIITHHGRFRIDFVAITASNRIIGIECDGEQYHRGSRDEWRDAAILSAGTVDVIYRIPGRALYLYPAEVWWLLGHAEPYLITERSRIVLNVEVSPTCFESAHVGADSAGFWVVVPRQDPLYTLDDSVDSDHWRSDDWELVMVERRTKRTPMIQRCSERLARHPNAGIDTVRILYSAEDNVG